MSLENNADIDVDNEDIADLFDIDEKDQTDENDHEGSSNDDEPIISFTDDEEDSHTSDDDSPKESSTIQELRRLVKQQAKQIAKLDKPVNQEAPIVVGEKPTLEQFEYDTDKYEAALATHYETVQKAADQDRAKQDIAKQAYSIYQAQQKELNVKNFATAEKEFLATFSGQQGATILKAAKNKALIVYALGSSERAQSKLLSLHDPIELAAEVARLEGTIKVGTTTKKNNFKPDTAVKGNVSKTATSSDDKQLEKLRAEAAKSGDFTKVAAYRRSLRK